MYLNINRGKRGVLDLAAAGNKSVTRPPLPPPGCGGEWKETGRKLVGQDKGSLTEQQTKGTGTTTIQKRGIHKTNQQNRARRTEPPSQTELPLSPPEPRKSSRPPAPPHRNPAWRHMVQNTRLCLARWGQPARLCPFPGFRWKLTLSWPNPGQRRK